MKTSEKILVSVGVLILLLLIAMMLLIRHTVQPLQSTAGLKHNYKAVSADNFNKLDLSSHFIVSIKQGKECKVELASGEDSVLTPRLKKKHLKYSIVRQILKFYVIKNAAGISK